MFFVQILEKNQLYYSIHSFSAVLRDPAKTPSPVLRWCVVLAQFHSPLLSVHSRLIDLVFFNSPAFRGTLNLVSVFSNICGHIQLKTKPGSICWVIYCAMQYR